MADFSSPVDEIKRRLDLVDYIQEFTPLTPAGANYKARCPFHTERTPSFMVSRDKQVWHCFGCGKGGDAFTFLQEIEGIEFPEALRLLAERTGVQLRSVDPKLTSQKTRLYDILRAAAEHYRTILLHSAQGEAGRAYLTQRGIDAATADAFGVGFAPDAWDGLALVLQQRGFRDEDILAAGLLIKRERGSGFYDRFRNRLMFPIRDHNGTTLGFGGRILREDPEHPGAKYINSPQTLVYDKSAVLFGLDLAKGAIKERKAAILVEGYLDCLSAFQAGTPNVVASSGTALTAAQAFLLRRYTTTVLVAFDADDAGAAARDRGLGILLSEEFEVRVVPIAGAKDPDELIRKDKEAWRQAVAKAPRFMDYYVAQVFRTFDAGDIGQKKDAARQLLPILALIGDPIERDHYLKNVAQRLRVAPEVLAERLPVPHKEAGDQPPAEVTQPSHPSAALALAERLLAFLFRNPELAQGVGDLSPEALPEDELRSLYKLFVLSYSKSHTFDFESFLSSLDSDALRQRATILRLLADRDGLDDPATITKELEVITLRLRRAYVAAQLRTLSGHIRAAEGEVGSGKELARLLETFHTLTEQLKRIS